MLNQKLIAVLISVQKQRYFHNIKPDRYIWIHSKSSYFQQEIIPQRRNEIHIHIPIDLNVSAYIAIPHEA